MAQSTTIEIDRETHTLIRQYCIINDIAVKSFINSLVNGELQEFKKKIESMRKIRHG